MKERACTEYASLYSRSVSMLTANKLKEMHAMNYLDSILKSSLFFHKIWPLQPILLYLQLALNHADRCRWMTTYLEIPCTLPNFQYFADWS